MENQPLRNYLRRVEIRLQELEPIISQTQIYVSWRASNRLVLKGTITFIDSTRLYFLEYLLVEGNNLKRVSYRFHYTDSQGVMVFRYDNAPHHPEVPSHPHHKHLSDGRVVAVEEKSLLDVLAEIASLILESKIK
ncbi:MAG: DUF6516 family protein [Sulfolobales archaeon]